MKCATTNIVDALALLQDELPLVATYTESPTPLFRGHLHTYYKRIDARYKGRHHTMYVEGGVIHDVHGPTLRYWDCNYGFYPLLGVTTAILCPHVHWRQDKGCAVIGGTKFISTQGVIDAFG